MQTEFGSTKHDAVLDLIENSPQTISYNGNGTVNYIEVTLGVAVYRQTYAYNGSNQLIGISKWVAQ